jgi:glycerol-3-phosphate dehydrogenase
LDFVYKDGQISGVQVKDEFSGNVFTVNSRVVVSAAGPWVDDREK